jgi:hypothetical protein
MDSFFVFDVGYILAKELAYVFKIIEAVSSDITVLFKWVS